MRVILIHGETPNDFADNYNAIVPNLKFIESQEFVDSTTMYVFYQEEPEAEPEPEPVRKKPKWFCADCLNYRWGKGCDFKEGVIRPLHEACEFLNVEVSDEKIQS